MTRKSKPIVVQVAVSALGGICLGLGFNSYIAYRLAPTVPLIIMLYFFPIARKENWIKTFISTTFSYVLLSIASVVPLVWYYLTNPGSFFLRSSQVSILASAQPLVAFMSNIGKTIQMLFIHSDINWRHNYSGHAQLSWQVAVVFAVACIIALH